MGPETAYLYGQAISAGGNLLASQFDGDPSLRKQRRDMREIIKTQAKYEPGLINARTTAGWDATFQAAKKHGVHPLVAMGVSPGAQGGGTVGGVYGQSARGSHIARAIDAAADSVRVPALQKMKLEAEIDLIKAQARALGQRGPSVPGPHGQELPAEAAPPKTNRIHQSRDEESNVQRPSPPIPHDTHHFERFSVTSDGKIEIIPRGTPGDTWEQEFGELGSLHPENIKRFFRYLIENDYWPSRNDWRSLYQSIKNMNRAQRAETERGIKRILESRVWYHNRVKDKRKRDMQKRYDMENRRVRQIRNYGAG